MTTINTINSKQTVFTADEILVGMLNLITKDGRMVDISESVAATYGMLAALIYRKVDFERNQSTNMEMFAMMSKRESRTFVKDVIEFKDWCMNIPLGSELENKTTSELFEIWVKQR